MKSFCHILGCLLALSLGTVGQVSKKTGYEINGSITGLNNDRLYLVVRPLDESRRYDTLVTTSIGDKFRFSGNVQQERMVELYIGDVRSRRSANFYLEPGKIEIMGNSDSLSYLSVTGTKTNNDYMVTQRYLLPIYARRSALIQKMRSSGDNESEPADLVKEIKSKTDSINAYKVSFMESHPSSEISLGYLYVLQDGLPTNVLERIYNSFSPELKNSQTGKYIYTKFQANKTVAVGKKAPDFTSTDTSGVRVNLSDFKGKYVLLEFWANWCVPCRALNPHLKEVYRKYKDRGFTIIQYSVDVKKDEGKWKEAIRKDDLPWTQLCDLQNAAPVAKLYGVQPIPDSFLISPEGIILSRRLSPKELDKELSKLLN